MVLRHTWHWTLLPYRCYRDDMSGVERMQATCIFVLCSSLFLGYSLHAVRVVRACHVCTDWFDMCFEGCMYSYRRMCTDISFVQYYKAV